MRQKKRWGVWLACSAIVLMLGGLTGVVIRAKRHKAIVAFGTLEMEIEMHDLLPAKSAA